MKMKKECPCGKKDYLVPITKGKHRQNPGQSAKRVILGGISIALTSFKSQEKVTYPTVLNVVSV